MDRRAMLGAVTYASVALAGGWGAVSAGGERRVLTIDEAESRLRQLAAGYTATAPVAALPQWGALFAVCGRERFGMVGVEAGTAAGIVALNSGRPELAGRYVEIAADLASDLGSPSAMSRVLGVQAMLESAHLGRDRPQVASSLLQRALQGAAPGLHTMWLHLMRARELAAVRDVRGAMRALDDADRQLWTSGEGFWGADGFLAGFTSARVAGWAGDTLATLGLAQPALEQLAVAITSPSNPPRAIASWYVTSSLAYVADRDPERACESVTEAWEECEQTRYGLGLVRARRIVSGFPENWGSLGVVRDLRDWLRLQAPRR